jgi:hypothetical protein
MFVTLKVGSMVNIPVGNTGFVATSGSPFILAVNTTGGTIAITALKPGQSIVTLKLAGDLAISLVVQVV